MKILSTMPVRARSQKVVMALSTIGRCAAIQLLLLLGTSPPPTAANQPFRGSIRHHTNGCAYFTTRNSCPTGTGECTWHPQNGCASATATVQMTEARMKSRHLQTTAKPTRKLTNKPTTRMPTSKPTTRKPTNKPTTTRMPTNKPTTQNPVRRFRVSFLILYLSRSHRPIVPLPIHRHPSRHRQSQRR